LRGTPYLVPRQTIDIAVVKFNPGEDNPDDPFTLVNGEQIAVETGLSGSPHSLLDAFHPVVWYVASVNNEDTDTFFRHGLFVENSSGNPTPPCPSPTPGPSSTAWSNSAGRVIPVGFIQVIDINPCPAPPATNTTAQPAIYLHQQTLQLQQMVLVL
jgi:hypothetical protein